MIRVLLVDDHQLLRHGLRLSLQDAGFLVIAEASDGEEASRLAEELAPDVVLMDVTMPVLDGIEAARRIHRHDPALPIVMLTMHADPETARRALDAGAIGYLIKDSSIEEVAAALRLATDGETVVSPDVAVAMLAEIDALERAEPRMAVAGSGAVVGPSHAPTAGAFGHDDTTGILTPREREVLQAIAEGHSTKDAARILFISVKTVKNHLASIYEKLDARDRTQAVLGAARLGIIKLP